MLHETDLVQTTCQRRLARHYGIVDKGLRIVANEADTSKLSSAVTVVIVTWNTKRFFARLRLSLESQTVPFALVVVDNASSLDQRPKPEDFPIGTTIIQNEANLGFAAANNQAIARIDSPFVALLNPDAFPEPTWLQELLDEAGRHPEAASIGSTQISAESVGFFDGLGDCYHAFGVPWRGGFGWPRTRTASSGTCFSACAAAALYRVDAWRLVGGFDERFFCYCEDVDLGFRLWIAGYEVRQAHRAVVSHVGGGASGKKSEFAIYHGTRNRIWTFVKNMPGWAFPLLAPAHVATNIAFMLASLISGTAAPTFRGVSAALEGIAPVLEQRRTVQAGRRAPVSIVLAAMAWSPIAVLTRAPVVRSR